MPRDGNNGKNPRKRTNDDWQVPREHVKKKAQTTNEQPVAQKSPSRTDEWAESNDESFDSSTTHNDSNLNNSTISGNASDNQKKPKIPPIVVKSKISHKTLALLVKDQACSSLSFKPAGESIKILLTSIKDYTSVTDELERRKYSYHTFSAVTQRHQRFIIRGLGLHTEIDYINELLTEQGYDVNSITQLISSKTNVRGRCPYLQLVLTPTAKIFQILQLYAIAVLPVKYHEQNVESYSVLNANTLATPPLSATSPRNVYAAAATINQKTAVLSGQNPLPALTVADLI
jgi:hypothetical protein